MLEDYVERVRASCATTRSYVVDLKRDKIREVVERISSKCKRLSKPGSALLRYEFRGAIVTVSPRGRLTIASGPREEELEEFLEELLS